MAPDGKGWALPYSYSDTKSMAALNSMVVGAAAAVLGQVVRVTSTAKIDAGMVRADMAVGSAKSG